MQFSSRNVRKAFQQTQTPTLHSLKQTSKQKYQQTLTFMQEWTSDLMQRQSQLESQRQQLYTKISKVHTQSPAQNPLNIQKLIKQECLKRIQSLYLKQLAVSQASESQVQQEESLNQSNTFEQGSLQSQRESNFMVQKMMI